MNLPLQTQRHIVRILRWAICPLLLLTVTGAGPALSQGAPAVNSILSQGQTRYVAPVVRRSSLLLTKPAVAATSKAALDSYASYFGVMDPVAELRAIRSTSLGNVGDIIRYRQLHNGLPVIGAELVLSLDGTGQVNSLSGEVARNLKLRTLQPTLSAAAARQIALSAIGKYHPTHRAELVTAEPELSVFDARLIGPDSGLPASLVWHFEVTTRAPSDVRELVLVNAVDGGLMLHFNQVETALQQSTYTANGGSTLPGTLLCNETQPLCTGGVNTDGDFAHRYARETYDFYFSHHARDSFDGLGAPLISVVNYNATGFCPNAAWTGSQMIYCVGAPAADDVVGHELTHAVTQRSSNLLYYYQSGAINESFSDVWGEFLDLTNGSGNDASSVRWVMGEDFPGIGGGGGIRNMANPPAFGDPDRMLSPFYWTSSGDSGGVHINSGVNNKAVTLMVDGGSFNGYTITGIGISKVAALYYRVQTQHLTSGSDYGDLFLALNQACRNLIGGADGIVTSDCVQVANATNAVQMNTPPAMDASAEAPLCPVNQVPTDVYIDSFESGIDTARWTSNRLVGAAGTWYVGVLATAGLNSYVTAGPTVVSNFALTMVGQVTVPANSFLHFRHLFNQETNGSTYYDGGVVEYSADNGATWVDASSLHSAGKNYTGTLSSGFGNPAGGSSAFVGASHGFVSSRYALNALAGQPIQVRFRNASDSSVGTGLAWSIDEVRIYTCESNGSANVAPTADAGADRTVSPAAAVSLDGSASTDSDGYLEASEWAQISGPAVTLTSVGRSLSFNAPLVPVQAAMVFRLIVTDNRGAVSTDDVTVNVVNQQPVANGGGNQSRKPRDMVSLSGSATDSDGSIASYSWSQVGGPVVAFGKVFDTALGGSTNQSVLLSTGPVAVGSNLMILYFLPNMLTNAGGTVPLQSGSIYTTCTSASGGSCGWPTGSELAVTGSVTAAAVAGGTQPQRWTLLGAQLSDGTPVTGSFVFDASTFAYSSIAVTAHKTNSGSVRFIAPSVPATAVLAFQLTATDNAGGAGFATVVVGVTNLQPTADAGVDQAVKPRVTVPLVGTAGDPDGAITTHLWTQVSGPAVTLANTSTASTSFVAPSVVSTGTLVFRLTATDNDAASVTDEVSVQVTNVAPTANAGVDVTVNASADVSLAGAATDPDGTISTYSWTQTGGTPVTLTGATTATAQFEAPKSSTASVLTFQLTVIDNDGATAFDVKAVSVNASKGGGSLDLWVLAGLLLLLVRRQARWRAARRSVHQVSSSGQQLQCP
jgi:Zn-dependent metalloprotease